MSARTLRLLIAGALALVLVLVPAPPASAHARLVSSEPAGGATIEQPPTRIAIDFSESIESSFGGVQVFDPAGVRIEAGAPAVSASRLELPLPPIGPAGTYTVAFRVISSDGHPIEASYSFVYAPPATTTTEPAPTTGPDEAPTGEDAPAVGTVDDGSDRPERVEEAAATPSGEVGQRSITLQEAGAGTDTGLWLARVANYLALTALVGLLVAAVGLLGPGDHDGRRRAQKAVVVAAASLAASGAALFAFGLSNAAARPLPEALTGEIVGLFAGTRFGTLVLVQIALALATSSVALRARRRRGGAHAALVLATAALAAPALWGHAGSDDLAVVAVAVDWLHLVAVTAWVGGLAAVAWLHLRAPDVTSPQVVEPDRVLAFAGGGGGPLTPVAEASVASDMGARAPLATTAHRFSRLAGWAIVVVALTGVVNAALHLGRFGALVDTSWGRLVLVKAALFGVVALLGLSQRHRVLPRLEVGGRETRRSFARLVVVELAVMALAFGAATQLASSIPADAEDAARIQSFATAFGDDAQLNVTVDPAQPGTNVVHLYFLEATGRIDDRPRGASLRFEQGSTETTAELVRTGPGHYSAFGAELPTSGQWTVHIQAVVNSRVTRATGSVLIR